MIAARSLFLRACVIGFGVIGTVWGVANFQPSLQESTISKIAARILVGEVYKPEILLRQASLVELTEEAECRPLTVRSAAVVWVRIAELSDTSALSPASDRTNVALEAIRKSLACSPADPFSWLALFVLEPSAEPSYLKESYRLGPNEGWIALKRNPAAFQNFDELPQDLQAIVVDEFLKILKMEAYDDAMKIFVGPAWDKRELILSQIDRIPLRDRQGLASRLVMAGYDVSVPGVNLNTLH